MAKSHYGVNRDNLDSEMCDNDNAFLGVGEGCFLLECVAV